MRSLIFAATLFAASPALAAAPVQPVQQSGAITPGHSLQWVAPNVVKDSGPASNGTLTGIGVQSSGLGVCQNSGPITGTYSSLCLGFAGGIPTIAVGGNGSAALNFNLKGSIYPFPGSGQGNVLGPNSSTIGDIALWNNTTGTLLKDVPLGSLVFPTVIPGCVGDGVTDDTACVQAALNAGGKVSLGPHIYAINSTGLTCPVQVNLVGTQGNQIAPYGTVSGFRPLSVNETILNVPQACEGSIFEKFSLDMGAPGVNTSGSAVSMAGNTSNVKFSDIAMNAPCIGLDMNGGSIIADRLQITQVTGASCGGIRVGHLTTGGNTVDPRITNSTVQSVQTGSGTPAAFDLRVEDAGGLLETNNDFLFASYGTQIDPGANQAVYWATLGSSYYGDTNALNAMTIDTAASSAVVRGLTANGGWTSNAQGGDGITINNTGGGTVSGIHFVGMRVFSNHGNGINVLSSSASNVTVDASQFCGNGIGESSVILQSGVSYAAIRNNTTGNICDGFSSGNAASVTFGGLNANIIITGNDMYGSQNPIIGAPIGDSIVTNNTIASTQTPTIASASTISLSSGYNNYVISGTTGVSTINGYWNYRLVNMLTTGSVVFSTGGNIANAYTSASNVPFVAQYIPALSKWYLK